MATNSVLKNIDIREKHLGRTLVEALENAMDKGSKDVVVKKTVTRANKDQVLKFFGE